MSDDFSEDDAAARPRKSNRRKAGKPGGQRGDALNNMLPALLREMNRRVSANKGGKHIRLTAHSLAMTQLIDRAVTGDIGACALVLTACAEAGGFDGAPDLAGRSGVLVVARYISPEEFEARYGNKGERDGL